MHTILYDIFLIFRPCIWNWKKTLFYRKPCKANLIMLAVVCHCQAVLTAWIHSGVLSFLSVDMYRVCHIHLCKIYHAGIELSNVILSKVWMFSLTFDITAYTFDETIFFQKSRLFCTAAAIPNQFSLFMNRSLSSLNIISISVKANGIWSKLR